METKTQTNLLNIASTLEILGAMEDDSASILHRLIYAYKAYNITEHMLLVFDSSSNTRRSLSITKDLEEKTMFFAMQLFSEHSLISKNNFFAYFWIKYDDGFPNTALSNSNELLRFIIQSKKQLAHRLNRNIVKIAISLNIRKNKLSEDISDYLLLYTRFPIYYYLFAKKNLKKKVVLYLQNRIIVEKFMYKSLLKELKLTKFSTEDVYTFYVNLISKDNLGIMFGNYLWNNIRDELNSNNN